MLVQQNSKIQVAEYVVDSLPGMYRSAAETVKDQEVKQYLIQASETFETIVRNPDTRTALVESLVTSPLIDTIIAEMVSWNQDPDGLKSIQDQLTSALAANIL